MPNFMRHGAAEVVVDEGAAGDGIVADIYAVELFGGVVGLVLRRVTCWFLVRCGLETRDMKGTYDESTRSFVVFTGELCELFRVFLSAYYHLCNLKRRKISDRKNIRYPLQNTKEEQMLHE